MLETLLSHTDPFTKLEIFNTARRKAGSFMAHIELQKYEAVSTVTCIIRDDAFDNNDCN